jgi:Cu/Ag efflux protein CusF
MRPAHSVGDRSHHAAQAKPAAAMTMVFQVKYPALLDKVNTGDKIKFSAEKIGSAYTVTAIEAAK